MRLCRWGVVCAWSPDNSSVGSCCVCPRQRLVVIGTRVLGSYPVSVSSPVAYRTVVSLWGRRDFPYASCSKCSQLLTRTRASVSSSRLVFRTTGGVTVGNFT